MCLREFVQTKQRYECELRAQEALGAQRLAQAEAARLQKANERLTDQLDDINEKMKRVRARSSWMMQQRAMGNSSCSLT